MRRRVNRLAGGKLESLDGGEAIRGGEWQWAEENAVDEAKDGGGSRDAESQSKRGEEIETRSEAELAEGEPELMEHVCPYV